MAYATSSQTSIIARNLYLPEDDWCGNSDRCDAAGIPEDKRVFKTKAELALELIDEAIKNQINFKFVHMDAHYGVQPWLLKALEERKLTYVADISKSTCVFFGSPAMQTEEVSNERFKVSMEGFASTVEALLNSGKIQLHKRVIRDIQRGKLIVNFAAVRVRKSYDNIPIPGEYWLLIRQELDGSETKFSFSNAPEETSEDILAEWQTRRYWVERALEDGKSIAGVDQYRVTGWRGWHHHTAMVMMAMLFLLLIKESLLEDAPMLTLQDALRIVKLLIPIKQPTIEDVLKIIKENHMNRERSREHRLRKQKELLEGCKGME